MKKHVLLTVVIYIVVLIVAGCNKNVLPGGALDATATPTPALGVTVFVQEDATPNAGLDIIMHYPDNYAKQVEGTTDTNGNAVFELNDYGVYTAEIVTQPANGVLNNLYYDFVINDTTTDKTINLTSGAMLITSTPESNSIPASGGEYVYGLYYTNSKDRRYDLLTGNSLTSFGISSYSPENYVQVSGTGAALTITVPKYFDKVIPVEIIASDGANQRQIFPEGVTYTPELTPNWHFGISKPNAIFYSGTFETTLGPIVFDTQNLTADGFYMRLVSYEYYTTSDGWRDWTYYGGTLEWQFAFEGFQTIRALYAKHYLYSFNDNITNFSLTTTGAGIDPADITNVKIILEFGKDDGMLYTYEFTKN